jgi:hypothetical protein
MTVDRDGHAESLRRRPYATPPAVRALLDALRQITVSASDGDSEQCSVIAANALERFYKAEDRKS